MTSQTQASAPVVVTQAHRADDFRGDTAHLVRCIDALLDLDDAKALVRHGLGGSGTHAYRLLCAARHRLASAPPAAATDAVERFVIRRNGAFFRPNAQGCTNHVVAAGFYTREEADHYADVEGVTIEPLERYRAEADRTIAEAQRLLATLTPPPVATDREKDRSIEILRRALVWHGDPQRMATTREEWQQEIDAAVAWVKANPEPGRPSVSSFNAPPVATAPVVDAEIARIPAEAFWQVGHDGEGPDPSAFKARIFEPQTMSQPLVGRGVTPQAAIRAALAATPTTPAGER